MKRIVIALTLLAIGVGLFFGIKKNQRIQPTWMQQQIQEDLSFFDAQDVKADTLRQYFKRSCPRNLLVFYQIKDNKVYWSKNWKGNRSIDRVRKTTQMLNAMTRNRKLPNVEFLLTVHDGWFREEDHELDDRFDPDEEDDGYVIDPRDIDVSRPIFAYAKKEGAPVILFPDPLSESFARRSRKSISRSNKRPKYRWSKKQEIAFWRGGTTGRKGFTEGTWFMNPRSKLSMLSKYYPDLVDSGYTSFPGVKQETRHEMETILPTVSWTTHKNHLKYKYLVIPDGNTCTYPRYYLGLCSNSAVFKQNSSHLQWFYKGLQPFVHYIPVAHDFSDLPERVIWARQHDATVKKIAKTATQFTRDHLMPDHIYNYVESLLVEYSKLQKVEHIELLEGAKTYRDLKEIK